MLDMKPTWHHGLSSVKQQCKPKLLMGQKCQQQLEITPFYLKLILNLFLGRCRHYPAGSLS